VAVYRDGVFQDLRLEEGDEIVMPNKTDVVIVAGEVLAPSAIAHRRGATIRDYVSDAGGYTDGANTDHFVLRGLNGSSRVARESTVPQPGDEIMVVPEISGQTFQLVKDIATLVFQIALSTATVLSIK
jgi:protein involved in polysaccharide export with SLBB domain